MHRTGTSCGAACGKGIPALLLLICLVVVGGCAHGNKEMAGAPAPPVQADSRYAGLKGADALAETFGIELVSLRLTAAGTMLDLRYHVVDVEAATRILHQGSPVEITMVDPATGMEAGIPETMLGQLKAKTDRSKPGRLYYVLFKNPGNAVQSGGAIDIHFGDVVVKKVPVL